MHLAFPLLSRYLKLKLLAWVKAQKVNFCGVDWKALAADGYYDAAMKHVKTAGKQLAAFIAALKKLNGKVDSISIAGHSLGK